MRQAARLCTLGDKAIYLVGCAHVSKKSVEDVRETILEVEPDAVCIELCPGRFSALAEEGRWRQMDIFRVLKEKKAAFLLAQLFLSSFYQKIGERLKVRPGEELLEGASLAKERGAQLVFADRPIEITLKRVWRSLSLWNKGKLLGQFLGSFFSSEELDEEMVEKMKESGQLQDALASLSKSFPEVKETLIDERDSYLAEKIRTAPGKRIVAVVGAGHVPGILREIEKEHSISSLEEIPPPSLFSRIFPWALPLFFTLLVLRGFFFGSAEQSVQSVGVWVASHALLSGIGAALALGHPLAILASFFSAPLTSLNPLVAAGWIGGLVQAWVKKPTIGDLERVPEEIKSFKGFWSNPLTRILLVVVLANLGSSLGTLVSGVWIVKTSF